MDKIVITCERAGKIYEFPCYKYECKDEEGNIYYSDTYMMFHKGIELAFSVLIANEKNIAIEKEFVYMDSSHAIAKCRIIDNGIPMQWYFGETNYRAAVTNFEKEAPFIVAMNRAFDTAVTRFFGFPTKTYNSDGMPVLYPTFIPEVNDETDEKAEFEALKEVTFPSEGKNIAFKDAKKGHIAFILNDANVADHPELKSLNSNMKRYLELKAKFEPVIEG